MMVILNTFLLYSPWRRQTSYSSYLCLIMMILQIVALVCNFPGSQNPSAVRLNHWEVETLFHEFGHALHSLLSRTVSSWTCEVIVPLHNKHKAVWCVRIKDKHLCKLDSPYKSVVDNINKLSVCKVNYFCFCISLP